MKNNDLIVVIIFLTFLFLPNISYWFLKDNLDDSNYENRNLYEKPEFSFNDITNFPKKYENYYSDHLPYKNEIRKLRAQINYNIFGISSSERVIVGKDGWLFYNSAAVEDVDSISDYRKITKYTEQEKKEIKDSFINTRNNLRDKNIDFYILIIPNKENVYSDYLESKIKRSNNKYSKIEDLINYLNENTDLNVVYPKETLINGRKKENTYYKYDTHWNNYGSYLGMIELMKRIDSKFNYIDIKLNKINYHGDLATMNLMSDRLVNSEPTVIGFYDNIKYSCKKNSEIESCSSENPIYDKNILFVGDSFRNATVQYLAKLYKNSIFVHKSDVTPGIIDKYNPNIVVYEAVERYSNTMYNTDTLFN